MARFDANKILEGGKFEVRMLRHYGSSCTAPVCSGRLIHCLVQTPMFVVFILLAVAVIESWIQGFGTCENLIETEGSMLNRESSISRLLVTPNEALRLTACPYAARRS